MNGALCVLANIACRILNVGRNKSNLVLKCTHTLSTRMQYILVKPKVMDWVSDEGVSHTDKSFTEATEWLAPLSDVSGKSSYSVKKTQLTFGEDAEGRYTVTAANGHTWYFDSIWVGEKEGDAAAYWNRLKTSNQDRLYARVYSQQTLFLTNQYWDDGLPDGPRAYDDNKILFQFQSPAPKFVSGPGRVACQLEQLLSRLEKLD